MPCIFWHIQLWINHFSRLPDQGVQCPPMCLHALLLRKRIRQTAAFAWRSFLCIQKWSRTSERRDFAPANTWDALLVSSCLNASTEWNYGPYSGNLNHPIITHVEVEGEIVALPASTDSPILSLSRWVSHLCQAVLNLFIEFFSVAVAAWGFTVISFHNCARIPVSPTRFSIAGTSRCREKGRPRGILHPFCSGTDIQLALISATKYFTQTHIKAFAAPTLQEEKISPGFNRRILPPCSTALLSLCNHNWFPVCKWVISSAHSVFQTHGNLFHS